MGRLFVCFVCRFGLVAAVKFMIVAGAYSGVHKRATLVHTGYQIGKSMIKLCIK